MHYLVTGGAGFIGSHTCDALIAAGHDVTVIDDLSTGHKHNLHKAVTFIEGHCGDTEILQSVIPNVDGVIHLAAIASVQKSREEWQHTTLTNLLAEVAILEAISKRDKAIPFIYASSAAIYGDPEASYLPIAETTPTEPLTPYGADKLACELHARVARHVFNIPTLGLRFFNIYGPRQDPSSPYSGVISIFANRIPAGESISIFGDGKQTRDFVYVSNVVEHLLASLRLLESGNQPDALALNVCRGASVSVLELAETIAKLSQQQLCVNYAEARIGDIRESIGNPALARDLLNVSADISLEEGLQNTLSWMQS